MFNPYPYEDENPLNRPGLKKNTIESIRRGPYQVAECLYENIKEKKQTVVLIDNYTTGDPIQIVKLVTSLLLKEGIPVETVDISRCYKDKDEIEEMLSENLPLDRKKDPVLLFGKLFKAGYGSIFNKNKLNSLKEKLNDNTSVVIVYGAGSLSEELISLSNITVYFDVTPKQAVLRIKKGRYINLGDKKSRPFKDIMRRCYYYDFELATGLRKKLLEDDLIDFYIASDSEDDITLVPKDAFTDICSTLVKYPFRCKPVYLEGVWGGFYMKRLRNLPEGMKNCAWIFDLIPLEVSLLIKTGGNILEIPFFTFICKVGKSLMGKDCVETFGGYFPIRFNYDDTYHSSGNMSIQVHPPDRYCKDNFAEQGRQDESYYIIATGHGARTFVGLKEDCDVNEFTEAVKKSEIDFTPVDYEKYVNFIRSNPGMQFMLPSGTIHSLGRNQLILEIGSLTVGSYTFKMYDYLRLDLDGIPRPIHTYHGEKVLDKSRNGKWVRENIVQEPRLIREGSGWAEYVMGEHDLLYFSLYRYEFDKIIEGNTEGVFHVLTLVDGERVKVYAKDNPDYCYYQDYLDIVVVPASMGFYVIENLGDGPVCVHKTCLKKEFWKYV